MHQYLFHHDLLCRNLWHRQCMSIQLFFAELQDTSEQQDFNMFFLFFLWILLGVSFNSKISNYLRLTYDPGTYSVCLTQFMFSDWLNTSERCPYFCEKGLRTSKNIVSAKFNLESGRCDCFNTTALCQQPSSRTKNTNLVFYVERKLFQIIILLFN